MQCNKLTVRLGMLGLAVMAGLWCAPQAAAQAITTDSRIKTFVYNSNEVFTITTHYGYQSNIEFGPRETVETISVGDRVSWQIIPAGRRLFIRAMEENAHTNMTIVTNQRAYQIDLRSSAADAVFGSEELTYVVRFYYPPEEKMAAPPSAPSSVATRPLPAPVATEASAPNPIPPVTAASSAGMNYRYTYSGAREVAPTKIYDDGRTTYFKMRSGSEPQVAVLTASQETLPLKTRRTSEGLLAVDAIAPRFSLKLAGREVIVYNEADAGAL